MPGVRKFKIIYQGNVSEFEEWLLYNAEQEWNRGGPGLWCQLSDIYIRQLTIICINPYPEEIENMGSGVNQEFPSLKHIYMNTDYPSFYRWGIPGGRSGNHRIIYAIHNYHKVIMLHYFDKHYNGAIKRADLVSAEVSYADYCNIDPNLY